jgi:hypothetical protein
MDQSRLAWAGREAGTVMDKTADHRARKENRLIGSGRKEKDNRK